MDASEREFLVRLRATFEIEAKDILVELARDLIGLEDEAPGAAAALASAFRRAHSLKGAARAVGQSGIEAVCQALESVFAPLQDALAAQTLPWPPESSWFDAPHRAVDLMADALRRPGDPETEAAMVAVAGELVGLAASLPQAEPKAAAKAARAHDGLDAPPQDRPAKSAHGLRIDPARLAAILAGTEDMIPLGLSSRDQAVALSGMAETAARIRRALAGLTMGGRAAPPELAEAVDSLARLETSAAALGETAAKSGRALRRLVAQVGENAKSALMHPISSLLEIAPKLARDVARDQGKEVLVKIRGVRAMADRAVLTALRDPLIHLVRNAVDHGIEPPEERVRLGKPRRGTIVIETSRAEAGMLGVSVADDGRGLDPAKLVASAKRKGLIAPESAGDLSQAEAERLVFTPGFSTSAMVTEISGRGIGLDVVRERIEKLGGVVDLRNAPGRGLAVDIRLPITLAAFRGVLVGAGGRLFIMPSANVGRIMRVAEDAPMNLGGRLILQIQGKPIACARLAGLLGLAETPAAAPPSSLTVLVTAAADRRLALIVDEVLGETEARAKPFSGILHRVRNIAGAALLGSGAMALTLDAADLIKTDLFGAPQAAAPRPARAAARKKVLVAEDTVTSRMVLQNLLEAAGYETATAVDGLDAWEKLQLADFDLLVSDVEMPRLTGFELTERVRADARLARLPVVLVTSLASRADRERGAQAGASAYVVKGGFDQGNLLSIVAKFI
jgi:two-component system, chemotaxis family, sensor kinase CheA